jgi:hypothetical protein
MSHDKYTVGQRLTAHDAEILALQQAVKSLALTPGPQGKQGQTGASGADGRNGVDGRNGIDSHVAGPVGPPGRAGHSIQGERGFRGEAGPAGPKGDSIVGPAGPQGPQGERGDVCYIGPAEVEAAVAAVRSELLAQRAKFLGAIDQAISDNGGNSGAQRLVRAKLQAVKQDAGL